MPEIIITIDTDAQTEITVKGHRGKGCQALTKELEAALGSTTEDRPTHEFHQHPVKQTQTATR